MRVFIFLDEETVLDVPEELWENRLEDLKELHHALLQSGPFQGITADPDGSLRYPNGFSLNLKADELSLEDLFYAHRMAFEAIKVVKSLGLGSDPAR